jgi:HEPN domain-containing protein
MGGKSVYTWFQFADVDLALAEHALSMHPQPLEAICYHCQQSSEKYLKGYLLYKGLDVPRLVGAGAARCFRPGHAASFSW